MTDTEILNQVMVGMGFGGSAYHFDVLTPHYKAVFAFLLGAAIPEDILRSEQAIGCIMKGVTDSYYMTPGGSQFSQMFFQMASQLAVNDGVMATSVTQNMS